MKAPSIDWLKRISPWVWGALLLLAGVTRFFALDTFPPGIKYDAASNGASALNILSNGARPFFVNYMGAPEPLILYLQAISIAAFGANGFAVRWVTAASGVLTVATLYALARELTRDRRVAWIAAFVLAVAVEAINFSRTGLRVSLIPFFETATLLFFWRGWRTGRTRDFILAGALLGVGIYTYIAFLAVPIGLALLWLHQFSVARARWRERLPGIGFMACVAGVFALPRLLFQFAYPAASIGRASQVSLLQNPAIQTLGLGGVIVQRLLDYGRMFGIAWQGESFNVLHRPLLDPILFGCFLIGIAICLWRARKVEWLVAPTMLIVMLLPDFLGADASFVNEVRTIGVLTPAYLLVGMGAVFALDWTARRWSAVALIVALGVSALLGLNAYFVDYARATQSGSDLDYHRAEVAEAQWIARRSEPVYLPLNEYARSTVHYLVGARAPNLRSALRVDGSLNVPMRAWIVLPIDLARPRTEGILYVHDPAAYVSIVGDTVFVLPPVNPGSVPVEEQLRARTPAEVIRDSAGTVVASAYWVEASDNPFRFNPLASANSIRFSQGIELVASSLDSSATQPPGVIPFSLFWRIAQRTSDDYVIFVHLLDSNGDVLTAADISPALGAYPTYLWKSDEIVPTHHRIQVPARATPGKYTIEVGLYNTLTQNRLDVLDGQGSAIDSRTIIGSIKVAPRETTSYNPRYVQRTNFDNRVALIGYDLQPGDSSRNWRVTMDWQGLAAMERDYTFFAHVVDAEGKIIAQSDHQPQSGRYPTSIWDAGEQVHDDFTLAIPADAPLGKYSVQIGWYDWQTGERLPVRDANNQRVGDFVMLDNLLEVAR